MFPNSNQYELELMAELYSLAELKELAMDTGYSDEEISKML
jgi:hypothetical protein